MWQSFKAFLDNPYHGDGMSALDWFLFIGLILVIMIGWRLILQHVASEL